jgi:hypothetical protein
LNRLPFFAGRNLGIGLVSLAFAAILAACGGGSNGPVGTLPVSVASATPVSAPTSVATLAPASASTTAPVAANTAQAIAVPATVGVTGTFTLPAAASVPANTNVAFTATTTTPANTIALSSLGRRVQDATTSQLTVLLYEIFEFTNPTNSPVAYPAYPAFSFTLPATYNVAAGEYYMAFYNGSSWQRPITTAGTVSGQTITFAPPAGSPTYNANTYYGFALYYQPFAAPTPAPIPSYQPTSAPSAAPSAAPSGAPNASPSPSPPPGALAATPTTLNFGSIGTSQTLTVSQPNYAGTFSVDASSCAPAGATAYVTVSGPSPNFIVTSNAVGTCNLTVTGGGTGSLTIPVTVSTLSVGVQ